MVRKGNLQEYIAPTVAEDVPVEKRVIELPDDALNEFEALKQSKTLLGLLETVYDRGLQMSIPLVSDAAKQKVIGEYYSNHVEFVPKDEARYKVLITGYSINGNQFVNMDIDDGDILFINEELAITYSKSEADKVIESLGGENGFLQLRKVKVEE